MWKQHGGPIAPNFTYSATALSQALDPQCQAKAQRDQVAEEWTSAEECEPAGNLLYSSGRVCSAWVQQASRSKTTTKIQKDKHTYTHAHTHKNTGTATGQRSPEAPALYGCTKPHQARTTPRHRQDGSRKGEGVSHFRYSCKRDIKEDSLW